MPSSSSYWTITDRLPVWFPHPEGARTPDLRAVALALRSDRAANWTRRRGVATAQPRANATLQGRCLRSVPRAGARRARSRHRPGRTAEGRAAIDRMAQPGRKGSARHTGHPCPAQRARRRRSGIQRRTRRTSPRRGDQTHLSCGPLLARLCPSPPRRGGAIGRVITRRHRITSERRLQNTLHSFNFVPTIFGVTLTGPSVL